MENLQIIQDNDKNIKSNRRQNIIFAILMTILIFLVVILLTFTFICAPVIIKGDSMSPSLADGEIIMISKIHKTPAVGDIIVYKKPNEKNVKVIKRVIGVEGESFNLGTNPNGMHVLIKQNSLEETYVLSAIQYAFLLNNYGYTVTIPEGEVFTIGDNALNSIDGRNYGSIPITSIIGIKLD